MKNKNKYLLRSAERNEEAHRVKSILNNYDIEFVEIFSDDYPIPELLTEDSAFTYKGFIQIEQYCIAVGNLKSGDNGITY